MLRGLVVTHGDLADALLAAAQQIAGKEPGVEGLSNRDCTGDALTAAVTERLDAWGGAEGIVFTDLIGSSCTRAALEAAKGRRGVRVMTGVNLAMLVDFLMNRGRTDAAGLGERLERKGRENVRLFAATPGEPSASPGE